jgi:putative hydrolase of the HAD superfamily
MSFLPKAILFDLDDTIIIFPSRRFSGIEAAEEFRDSIAPLTPEDLGDAMEEYSIRFWADAENHTRWRFNLRDARAHIASQVFAGLSAGAPTLTPTLAQAYASRFHEAREAAVACDPGAIETLDELRRLGVKMALVTNGDGTGQRKKIVRFDLGGRFDHIQIEGEVGFGKPDPRAYLHAMETLGVGPAETWMVGDNLEWEVAAPQRLGIHSIWRDWAGEGLPAGSSVKPDRIVSSICQLLP